MNQQLFSCAKDKAFLDIFNPALEKAKLTGYRKELLSMVRKSVEFTTTEEEDYRIKGNTRFGGAPDLPKTIQYPTTDGDLWIFLAQINLEEISVFQDYLPGNGILYFFIEDMEDANAKVFYNDGNDALATFQYDDEDLLFYDENMDDEPFTGFKAKVNASWSLPDLYNEKNRLDSETIRLLEIENDAGMEERYSKFRIEVSERNRDKDDNNEPHGINTYVFCQNESVEEEAAKLKGGRTEEWMVLLSLGYDRNTEFCFWDAGTLTFVIRKQDLSIADFSNVVAFIESS